MYTILLFSFVVSSTRFGCYLHPSSGAQPLSLTHPHTGHQALLDGVTACVSHTENTIKFCACGKSRMHYLDTFANLSFYIVLCAVLCCVNLNWVWVAYCLCVRWLLAHPVVSTPWRMESFRGEQRALLSVSASFTIDKHRISRKGKIRNGTSYRKVVKGNATAPELLMNSDG
jgi:hypothetical protein